MDSTDILKQAFAAQAVEAARNQARARTAETAGRTGEARRFRALAAAQQLHADKALAMLAGQAELDTEGAAAAAMHGVDQGITFFQDGVLAAAIQRDAAVESALTHFMKAAMSHRTRLDKPAAESEFHVCQVCGFLVGETVPKRCPVCRAQAAQFQRID